MANLGSLQHYLTAHIEVENPAHGRGVLTGLPFTRIGEDIVAQVQFPADSDQYGTHEDFYELAQVVPVLNECSNSPEVLSELMEMPEWEQLGDINFSLNQMAAIVDKVRSYGIALNMPPGSYIPSGVPVRVTTLQVAAPAPPPPPPPASPPPLPAPRRKPKPSTGLPQASLFS